MTIPRFKHNTNNRPHDIIIDREDSLLFCPVKSLLRYRRSGVIHTDNFSALLKVALSLPVTSILSSADVLIFCGLDTSRYKSDSFRIGAACLAAKQVYSEAQIRALGRRHSDAFKVYIRPVALHANST